jgi:hypothetical protein
MKKNFFKNKIKYKIFTINDDLKIDFEIIHLLIKRDFSLDDSKRDTRNK